MAIELSMIVLDSYMIPYFDANEIWHALVFNAFMILMIMHNVSCMRRVKGHRIINILYRTWLLKSHMWNSDAYRNSLALK